jgi:hypothetical protein
MIGTWCERYHEPIPESELREGLSHLATGAKKGKGHIYYRSDVSLFARLQEDPYAQVGIATTISNFFAAPIIKELQRLASRYLVKDEKKSHRLPLLMFAQYVVPLHFGSSPIFHIIMMTT